MQCLLCRPPILRTALNSRLLVRLVSVIAGGAFLANPSFSQAGDADGVAQVQLIRPSARASDPVKVLGFSVPSENQVITLQPYTRSGATFVARRDWPNDLTLHLQNLTRKRIVAARFNFYCPGIHQVPDEAFYDFGTFVNGRVPNVMPSPDGASPKILRGLSVAPKQLFDFSFKADSEKVEAALKSAPSTRACMVEPQSFFFSDGTKWTQGVFYVYAESSTGHYKPLSATRFYLNDAGRPDLDR